MSETPQQLLTSPSLHGIMYQSMDYTNLGLGFTDRVLIFGHADGLAINDPVSVTDLRDVVSRLGADSSCPLLRGMLEAYYGGCRDIWICPVAPMSEYVEQLEDRDEDFYQTYADRLAVTYEILKDFDIPEFVVPLHAPIFGAGDVDFLTPLANFCQASFDVTGTVRIGFIGTALPAINNDVIDEMLADTRVDELGPAGKFVVSVIGSGLMNFSEIPTSYSTSPIASLAGFASQQAWDVGLTYQRIPNLVAIDFPDIKKDRLKLLCEAKFNPLARTTRAKRGRKSEVVLLTDNTLGEMGSDFWSVNQVRLIMHCINDIRDLGNRYLGTIGFGQFKTDVQTYMTNLVAQDIIRGFNLNITKLEPAPDNHTITAQVDLAVQPFFGLREIAFTALVGPGQ